MSFTAKQYEDVFDMAEFVYLSIRTNAVRGIELQKIRDDAQKMMLAVEMVVGQLRTGEDRERLGLGKPGGVVR